MFSNSRKSSIRYSAQNLQGLFRKMGKFENFITQVKKAKLKKKKN